jgi:RimJ/RimL family protein N-acetyltransferase
MPTDLSQWKGAKLPELTTLRGRWVTLEPLCAKHHTHDLWNAVEGHDQVWTFLGDGPFAKEPGLFDALYTKEIGSAARFFAILPTGTGKTAGYASLMRIDAPHGVIEVGNVLFSPQLQRTPAATEAMFLMMAHAFDDLGYRRYEWKCNAQNAPSRKAADRLGFSFEGVFRQHMVVKGKNRDTAWYSMLDSEWPARKRIFQAWLSPENFDKDGHQRRSLSSFAG